MAAMVVDQMEMRMAAGVVATEIKTRIEAETKAQAIQNGLQAFVDHVPVAIALIGNDGEYHGRSDRWVELQRALFSADAQDNFAQAISVRDDWRTAFETALSGKTVASAEDAFLMQDGSTEYAKWELEPWYADDGTVEGAVLSVTMISEQVITRLELERQNELFNAVIENIDEGIVACDEDGQLTLFNTQTRVMHGLEVTTLPIEECGEFYSLYEESGTTLLEPGDVPLFRALNGTPVINKAMVIAPKGLPRRDIVSQATPLYRQDGTLLGAVASMADVTASKLATRKLRESEAHAVHTAFHDTLTGLANRAKFNEWHRDRKLMDGDMHMAAFFIDLNRFKLVNDTLGHKIGDDLLIRVAEILKKIVGGNAFLTRFGGDEFVAIMPVEDSNNALHIGQKIIDQLNAPTVIADNTVVTGASVGIALSPDHGDTAEALVRRADIAMYRCKSENADAPVMFEPVFELNSIERTRMESELIQSIKNDELRVFLQPIVCGTSQNILGVEALVRWKHPRLGMVGPDKFIPIAEECGFIIELGEWVLNTALEQVSPYDDLFVSVNVSPVQFRDPNLVQKIMTGLERTNFDPNRLELEVTESLLLNDAAVARQVIGTLKAEGISIALDDFGTGYSSLSYIQSIPFNKIKIDRSFVNQLGEGDESKAVVQCVVDLASAMGMIVTAEGVETLEHETMLKMIGCHTLQGYKYGRPSRLEDICGNFKRIAAA